MIESSPKETCSLFDLSDRAKFRVRGSDRLRFLNGQITNDLRKATETEAIEACILNAKGKIDAHVFICAAQDAYLLDTDADLRETIPARLDRYIIADDVQVEDVSDEFDLFHFLDLERPDLPNECVVVRARRFSSCRLGCVGKANRCQSYARILFTAMGDVRCHINGDSSYPCGSPALGPGTDKRNHSYRSEPGRAMR